MTDKFLEDMVYELRGIKTILGSMWHSRYKTDETDRMNPEAYADEYISTEECAKRLNISDQTIRNWIAKAKTHKDKGWVEGIHYVNVCPNFKSKPVIRIPWNELIRSFAKNKSTEIVDLREKRMYQPQNTVRL